MHFELGRSVSKSPDYLVVDGLQSVATVKLRCQLFGELLQLRYAALERFELQSSLAPNLRSRCFIFNFLYSFLNVVQIYFTNLLCSKFRYRCVICLSDYLDSLASVIFGVSP